MNPAMCDPASQGTFAPSPVSKIPTEERAAVCSKYGAYRFSGALPVLNTTILSSSSRADLRNNFCPEVVAFCALRRPDTRPSEHHDSAEDSHALMGSHRLDGNEPVLAAQIGGLILCGLLAGRIGVPHVFAGFTMLLALPATAGRLWMEPEVSA
ncbi:MAG TPA: hypothetical protein VGU23_07695 [Acidobacteriaceae bacterium]|nr:hypothetical protein [Acidobacteriaceae bacterium]